MFVIGPRIATTQSHRHIFTAGKNKERPKDEGEKGEGEGQGGEGKALVLLDEHIPRLRRRRCRRPFCLASLPRALLHNLQSTHVTKEGKKEFE